jgi:MYXO-CTERM domain-containing protein
LEYVDTAGMPQTINQFGSWFVVPEPDSMVAATLAALAVSGFVRRRRRETRPALSQP